MQKVYSRATFDIKIKAIFLRFQMLRVLERFGVKNRLPTELNRKTREMRYPQALWEALTYSWESRSPHIMRKVVCMCRRDVKKILNLHCGLAFKICASKQEIKVKGHLSTDYWLSVTQMHTGWITYSSKYLRKSMRNYQLMTKLTEQKLQ